MSNLTRSDVLLPSSLVLEAPPRRQSLATAVAPGAIWLLGVALLGSALLVALALLQQRARKSVDTEEPPLLVELHRSDAPAAML